MRRIAAEVTEVFNFAQPTYRFVPQEGKTRVVKAHFVNRVGIENLSVAQLHLLRPGGREWREPREVRRKSRVGIQEIGVVPVIISRPVAQTGRVDVHLDSKFLVSQTQLLGSA